MQQDEGIEKGQKKDKSITLVAQNKDDWDDTMKMKPAKATPNKDVCEGRFEDGKGKGKMIEEYKFST